MLCYFCNRIMVSECITAHSADNYEDSHERKIRVCLRCETDFLNHAKHPNGKDYVSIFQNNHTGRFKILTGGTKNVL